MPRRHAAFAAASFASVALLSACSNNSINPPPAPAPLSATKRVLLLSIDGMHTSDLSQYVAGNPNSALSVLALQGVTYSAAATPAPSDSFPGLLALVTGGTPKTTGVYYEDSYDRSLYPPGSDCSGSPGTEIAFAQNIDLSQSAVDLVTGIDETQLPKVNNTDASCDVVYPHSFLQVNTIFEVVKANKGYTAWSDMHPAFELVNGPSGTGVDDLFVPEINTVLAADFTPDNRAPATVIPANTDLTAVYAATETYDDYKVNAILNQIDGESSDGATAQPVPTLFGMNFQALSVAQRNDDGGAGGYNISSGEPTPKGDVADALAHTDASIQLMLAELQKQNLLDSTLIIVTARNGQSPTDSSQLQEVSASGTPAAFPFTLAMSPGAALGSLVAQATEDDVSLIWLKDRTQTSTAVGTLNFTQNLGIYATYSSISGMPSDFGNPENANDSRVPDIAVQPNYGVIYTTSSSTIAAHGGFADDDRDVALLVSIPGLSPVTNTSQVSTTQVAPTILQALGIAPTALEAVKTEQTQVLPGLF